MTCGGVYNQRTQSATDVTAGSESASALTDAWNPFSNAPGFEQRAAAQMDDLSFGQSFDQLPRMRKGSISSELKQQWLTVTRIRMSSAD